MEGKQSANEELLSIMENLPCRLHICWRRKMAHHFSSEEELKQAICDCLCDWKTELSGMLLEELKDMKLLELLIDK